MCEVPHLSFSASLALATWEHHLRIRGVGKDTFGRNIHSLALESSSCEAWSPMRGQEDGSIRLLEQGR